MLSANFYSLGDYMQPAHMHTFTFPNQETIVAYYGTHPAKENCLDTPVMANNFPSIEKVAGYFAGKVVKREDLKPELKQVIIHKERVQMMELQKTLEEFLAVSYKNAVPYGFSQASDNLTNDLTNNSQLEEIAITCHAIILTDQQENAFYTPPSEGETCYVRHVKQL